MSEPFSSSPYRARPREADARLLPFELVPPAARDLVAELRREWSANLPALFADDGNDAETELRIAWLTAVLAASYARDADRDREESILATAFEGMKSRAYRARVAARLARLSAQRGAIDTADAWLASAPSASADVEVEADVEVARAMVAHARGDLDGALDIIGTTPAASPPSAGAAAIAAMLRVDVFERRDDGAHALRLYGAAERAHGAATLREIATRFGLAPKTRRGFPAVALATASAVTAVATAVVWLLSS